MREYPASFMDDLAGRYPGEPEFLQAVREVADTVGPVLLRHPEYRAAQVLERMVEPDRAVLFRVAWTDDDGAVQVNRGYRVQMNGALGPYKGGLRFHPSVTLGLLKFLAFEQTLKNALTTLPMGGGKGGSDFDPKGRSDAEVARFCQAFMTELHRHIGQFTDVPAGDIGVGGREIGYLFGQYRRLANEFTGAMTGKGVDWGGSWLRPEATGYGTVYFAQEMLATQEESLEGRTCLVSGSGNVAQFTVEKLVQLGARPVTMSDSSGFVHDPDGIDLEKLELVKELKNVRRGRIHEYVDAFPRATFHATELTDHNPMWAIPAECAFPSATENEIAEKDAIAMVHNGIELVAEGANMPTTSDAVRRLTGAGVLFGPAKAANAGGVAVSGLEMSQDSLRLQWRRDEVDERLRSIMRSIHTTVLETAEDYERHGDYVFGANAAGFDKVAGAMLAQGVA